MEIKGRQSVIMTISALQRFTPKIPRNRLIIEIVRGVLFTKAKDRKFELGKEHTVDAVTQDDDGSYTITEDSNYIRLFNIIVERDPSYESWATNKINQVISELTQEDESCCNPSLSQEQDDASNSMFSNISSLCLIYSLIIK